MLLPSIRSTASARVLPLFLAAFVASCSGGASLVAPTSPGGNNASSAGSAGPASIVESGKKADWARWGFDGARTGYNPFEKALTRSSVGKLKRKWAYTLNGPYANTQPIIAGSVQVHGGAEQVVYVGDEHGYLYAINAATGKKNWTRSFGSEDEGCSDMPDQVFGNTSAPLYDAASGRLYVIATDPREDPNDHTQDVRRLYALDPATGKGVAGWKNPVAYGNAYRHNTYSGLNMSADGSLVYFDRSSNCDEGTYYGAVGSVNTSTQAAAIGPDPTYGTITATEQGEGYYAGGVWSWGNPVVDPDTGNLYATVGNSCANGGCDGPNQENSSLSDSVIELSGTSLALLGVWQSNYLQNDADFGTSATAMDVSGSKCTAAGQKTDEFYSFDRTNLGAGPDSSLNVNDELSSAAFDPHSGVLFMTSNTSQYQESGGTVQSFTVQPGCTLDSGWTSSSPAQATYSSVPVIANGIVYVSGYFNLYALDESSGKVLWTSATLPGYTVASPAVVNGCVYAVSWSANFNNAGHAIVSAFCL